MRYLTAEDARDVGVLLEVNRRLLHPRGLAMQASICTDAEEEQIYTLVLRKRGVETLREIAAWMNANVDACYTPEQAAIWHGWLAELDDRLGETLDQPNAAILLVQDHRDDPEGVIFGDLDDGDVEKAVRFEGMLDDHGRSGRRVREFGWVVQPVEETLR